MFPSNFSSMCTDGVCALSIALQVLVRGIVDRGTLCSTLLEDTQIHDFEALTRVMGRLIPCMWVIHHTSPSMYVLRT